MYSSDNGVLKCIQREREKNGPASAGKVASAFGFMNKSLQKRQTVCQYGVSKNVPVQSVEIT